MFTLTLPRDYCRFNIIFVIILSFFFYLQQSYTKKKHNKTKLITFYQLNRQ